MNNNTEHNLIKENKSLKSRFGKAELAAAGAQVQKFGSEIRRCPFANIRSFTFPQNLLSIDLKMMASRRCNKRRPAQELSHFRSQRPQLPDANGADVSALQGYIGIGLVGRHQEDTSKYRPRARISHGTHR